MDQPDFPDLPPDDVAMDSPLRDKNNLIKQVRFWGRRRNLLNLMVLLYSYQYIANRAIKDSFEWEVYDAIKTIPDLAVDDNRVFQNVLLLLLDILESDPDPSFELFKTAIELLDGNDQDLLHYVTSSLGIQSSISIKFWLIYIYQLNHEVRAVDRFMAAGGTADMLYDLHEALPAPETGFFIDSNFRMDGLRKIRYLTSMAITLNEMGDSRSDIIFKSAATMYFNVDGSHEFIDMRGDQGKADLIANQVRILGEIVAFAIDDKEILEANFYMGQWMTLQLFYRETLELPDAYVAFLKLVYFKTIVYVEDWNTLVRDGHAENITEEYLPRVALFFRVKSNVVANIRGQFQTGLDLVTVTGLYMQNRYQQVDIVCFESSLGPSCYKLIKERYHILIKFSASLGHKIRCSFGLIKDIVQHELDYFANDDLHNSADTIVQALRAVARSWPKEKEDMGVFNELHNFFLSNVQEPNDSDCIFKDKDFHPVAASLFGSLAQIFHLSKNIPQFMNMITCHMYFYDTQGPRGRIFEKLPQMMTEVMDGLIAKLERIADVDEESKMINQMCNFLQVGDSLDIMDQNPRISYRTDRPETLLNLSRDAFLTSRMQATPRIMTILETRFNLFSD